jgi:hypothetical protein
MEEATTSLYTDMMNELLFKRKKCLFFIFLLLGLSFYGADCSNNLHIFLSLYRLVQLILTLILTGYKYYTFLTGCELDLCHILMVITHAL